MSPLNNLPRPTQLPVRPPENQPHRSSREKKGQPPERYGWSATTGAAEPVEPSSWREAMGSVNALQWRIAAEAEYDSLTQHQTWQLVDPPPGRKIIGSRWTFKVKHNEYGKIERFKARFVVQGFSQKYGIDYNQIFAPVVRWESI